MEPGGLDVEELAVPGDVVDQRALERLHRRVEGLQRAERHDVDPADGTAVEPALRSRASASTSGSSGTRSSMLEASPAGADR